MISYIRICGKLNNLYVVTLQLFFGFKKKIACVIYTNKKKCLCVCVCKSLTHAKYIALSR